MQKLLLIIQGLFVSVRAAAPTLSSSGSNAFPETGTTLVPVKDFSVLLSFSERVQKGTGTITVRPCSFTSSGTCSGSCSWDTSVTPNVCKLTTSTTIAAQKSHTAGCTGSSGKLEFFDKVVLVPITTELTYGKDQHVNIPSACFKNTGGEMLAANYFADTYKFKTDVSARCSMTKTPPVRLSGSKPTVTAGQTVPLDPVKDAWVTSSKKWTLYFSEAVQAGEGQITIKDRSGRVDETLLTNFSASNSFVSYKGVGKIEISASAFAYKNGREYTLQLGDGAFKDSHNNFVLKDFVSSAYKVKVATKFNAAVNGGYTAAGWFPKAGCCNSSFNFTSNYRLVWTFEDEVIPVTSSAKSVYLCSDWSPTSACKTSVQIATGDIVFLGKTVILNPQGKITATTQKTYNVSIPPSVFAYYDGLSASSDKSWTYSFTANLGSFDFTPPELVKGLVDCNGNDILTVSSSNHYSASCDNNNDGTSDFNELYDSLTSDGNSPMSNSAQFKLYFKEKVTFAATTMKATLRADDGTSTVDIKKSDSKVVFYTSSKYDCSVTINPTLKTGKKYTLSVASGQIVDASTAKNAYAGTSFTFYTRLQTTTNNYFFPANTATLVPKETAIKIDFKDQPRLGPTPGQSVGIPKITVGGVSYNLNDTNKVKFQDNQITIFPTGLLAAKTYVVSIAKHHLRYMTSGLSFSFTTRAEDVMPPSPLLFSPDTSSAVKSSKLALDNKAPYILFSEGIKASTTASITLRHSSATYKIAASDTTCTATKGCVVIESNYKHKVLIYPIGKTTNTATAWVTAGKTYTLEVPAGAFSDSLTTGVNSNPMAMYTTKIYVDADTVGPVAAPTSSITYGAGAQGGTLMTATAMVNSGATAVQLAFNENIQAGPTSGGNSFAIKSFPYSVVLPNLNTNDHTFPSTVSNNVHQTITLSFDAKVQAGSGTVSVLKTTDAAIRGTAVKALSRTYVGHKMIFKATTALKATDSYYVVSTKPVHSSDPDADNTMSTTGGVINTKSAGQQITYVAVDASGSTPPVAQWSSLEEYHCLPGDGKMPNVDVYWSEDVKFSATEVAHVYACSDTSDCASTTTKQIFKKTVKSVWARQHKNCCCNSFVQTFPAYSSIIFRRYQHSRCRLPNSAGNSSYKVFLAVSQSCLRQKRCYRNCKCSEKLHFQAL